MTLLAQIIAGEAQGGNNSDSYGVAATIYNRTQGVSGYTGFGYGLSPTAAAANHNQFEAYPNRLGTPSAYQQSLADSLENGTFPSMGNPGNATFYNAPNTNPNYAAGVGNNYGSGSNQYSNRFNATPGNDFVLPQAGATNPNTSTSTPSNTGGLPSEGDGLTHPDGANPNGGDSVTMAPNANDPTDITNIPVQGVNAPLDNPITPNAPKGSGSSSSNAPQSGATDGGGGTPIQITDPTKIAAQAGDTVSKALGGVTTGIASDTQSIEATGGSWLSSIFAGGTSLLVRGGLILVGLFLLLGAFVFFYVDSKTSQSD